jgi:hypothetical protein
MKFWNRSLFKRAGKALLQAAVSALLRKEAGKLTVLNLH